MADGPPMPPIPPREAEVARLLAAFAAAGAEPVSPEALQPAETLLDLYGEDIRARAYVVREGYRERMLRPDFTVPVVRHHIRSGRAPARYAYAGPVWRRPAAGSDRPPETWQAGFEILGATDPATADAEVFQLLTGLLPPGLTLATGDIGLLRAAVAALSVSPARQQALLRHIWRPHRFESLIERFSEPPRRIAALLRALAQDGAESLYARAGKPVGLRSRAEVLARTEKLVAEAAEPPLAAAEIDLLKTILTLSGTVADVAATLGEIARGAPPLRPAADRFARRAEALAKRGMEPADLPFEGAFGRTTLEYYDGFVFGALAPGRPDLPVIAGGGRYDALTRALGQPIPAGGGIIRPEALLAMAGQEP